MSSINQQGTANPLSLSDLLLIWSTSNGDTRKASITALLALLQDSLTFPSSGITFLPTVGGGNAIVAFGAAGVDIPTLTAGDAFLFFGAVTNTGATTINIDGQGVYALTHNTGACTGGEVVAGSPVLVVFNGVNLGIVATGSGATRTGTEALTNKSYSGSFVNVTGDVAGATAHISGLATLGSVTTGTIGATSINFGQSTLNYYGTGTWTPVDASGAALSLTPSAPNCVYTKIGDVCILGGDITYPATANGNAATVGGLPFASSASVTNDIAGGVPARNTLANSFVMNIGGGGISTMSFRSFANVALTNANLTGVTFRFLMPYKTA